MNNHQARITSITIENFKGIKDAVTIPLKPITLLFGANSAGKSTVLHALAYAREILERHNIDADKTLLGGEAIDLGGFDNLVNGHNAHEKNIKLRFDFDFPVGLDQLYPIDEYIFNTVEGSQIDLSTIGDDIENGWIEMEMGYFYEYALKPDVLSYEIGLDNEFLAKFEREGDELDGNCILKNFNFEHSVISMSLEEGPRDELEEDFAFCNPALAHGVIDGFLHSWQNTYNTENNRSELSYYDKLIIDHLSDALPWGVEKLSLQIYSDMNPVERVEQTDYDEDIISDEMKTNAHFAVNLMSRLILGPTKALCNALIASRYIGPIREIPERDHALLHSPDASRWGNGLAAWDTLLKADPKNYALDDTLIEEVNKHLRKTLDLEYQIERRDIIPLEFNGTFMTRLKHLEKDFENIEARDIEVLNDMLKTMTRKAEVKLRDTKHDVEVAPNDIGVGISQVIPVIVGLLAPHEAGNQPSIVAIEQPELHLHPAVQCKLGDLLIHQKNSQKKFFSLIETHSEHMILRILRRIRESSEETTENNKFDISKEDVCVLYVDTNNGKTIISEQIITDDGDFEQDWPNGFFEERAEELF